MKALVLAGNRYIGIGAANRRGLTILFWSVSTVEGYRITDLTEITGKHPLEGRAENAAAKVNICWEE
jgi:hypothetical protein